MILEDLIKVDGCPQAGLKVTVYGIPWNAMLMFGAAAGPVRNKNELKGFFEIVVDTRPDGRSLGYDWSELHDHARALQTGEIGSVVRRHVDIHEVAGGEQREADAGPPTQDNAFRRSNVRVGSGTGRRSVSDHLVKRSANYGATRAR